MSDHERPLDSQKIDPDAAYLISRPLSKEDSETLARNIEDSKFKQNQIKTNNRLVFLNFCLVIGTAISFTIGIFQIRFARKAIEQADQNAIESSRQFQIQLQHFDAGLGRSDMLALHAGEQAAASEKLADAAKRQADLGRQSLQAAISNFHQEQRAWLGVNKPEGFPKDIGPYDVKIPVQNTGKTPAVDIKMYFGIQLVYKPGLPVTIPLFPGPPQPLGTIVPGGTYAFVYHQGVGLEGKLAAHPDGFFSIYGGMTYKDVFSIEHWLTFCFTVDREGNSQYCPIGNDIGDGPAPMTKPLRR